MSSIQSVPRALLSAVALLCALVLAPAAATANATPVSVTLDQACEYPVVGAAPVTTKITADLPAGLADGMVPAAPVTVQVTAPPGAGLGLLGGSSLEGELVLKVTVDAPGSGTFPLTAKLPFAATSLAGSGAVTLTGSGELPKFGPLVQSGTATYRVDSVALNATLRKADGTVKRLPPVDVDSDGDPDTFDAACVLDPAGQDPTLYEPTVISDPVPSPGFGHQCSLPLVGNQPMALELHPDAPPMPVTREPWPEWSFDLVATFNETTSNVLLLLEAASIEGTATVDLTLSLGGGLDVPFTVPVELANVAVPSGGAAPLPLRGKGTVPPIFIEQAGSFTVSYDDISFNFLLRNADGSVRPLPGPAVITSGPPNTFDVDCVLDPAGQDTTIATGDVVISDPFLVKPKATVSSVGFDSARVSWTSANAYGEADRYEVVVTGPGGTKQVSAYGPTATSAELSGLREGTAYTAVVRAYDIESSVTVESAPVSFETVVREEPAPVKYGYGVSGAAQLKNLTRGSVPLSGSVDAELELATGDFSAELSLQRSTANLVALGFLPVVAKVDVVPTVPVTGNLAGGVLTAATKVRIKLPQVTLFGLQLAGGSNCQTRSASAINLKSVGEFDALDGGTLAGTFSISDLTGCGVLTGLVSPLTSGPGNTIALKLAPAA